MSQVKYRGNLSAKAFPFISEFFGRTVIIPGQDQNFSRQLASSEDLDKDRGIPQLYYCHNVMPTAEGFQSIGFTDEVTDNKLGFINLFPLRDISGQEVYFAHNDTGRNYILPFGAHSWHEVTFVPGALNAKVSVATVNGQSYIYFEAIGCYTYDAATDTLLPVTLTGLDPTQVIGITSSAGYLIAWSMNSVAWSSTISPPSPAGPIDFVPSLITGAGAGNIEAAKGVLTICVTHYLGFIIYTTDNAIAAVYSGNARYPFNFREIVASGGLADQTLISFDTSSGNHYAYTTSGLQLISINQTQTVYPEITDFIAGKYFEDFNESTLEFETQVLTSPMKKAINILSDRYLVISYGVFSLTHALVFDLIQKRFGKIKLDHVRSFEFNSLAPEVIETPRESIGFLLANGSIKVVDFSYNSDSSNGVMILGKYQLNRTRLMQLQEVTLENTITSKNFNLYDIVSVNGKTLTTPVAGYLAIDEPNFKSYNFHVTGINHSLLCKGSFYANTLLLTFNIHGRR